MAAGEAFSAEQRDRIHGAVSAFTMQTGIPAAVRVGAVEQDAWRHAERILAQAVERPTRDLFLLILVGPGERQLEVVTTPATRQRLSDQACGLAVLTMTSSFAVGDLVGGLVNGLRQLADAAGTARPEVSPGALVRGSSQPLH